MSEQLTTESAPHHGGNLQRAIRQYGGETCDWLDLSTGISPYSWPVEQVLKNAPKSCWQQLPDQNLYTDAQFAAADYYSTLFDINGNQPLLAAGTQAIIQQLPYFFADSVFQRDCQQLSIWLLAGSYGEHQFRWQQAGVQVVEKSEAELRQALTQQDSELPDVLLLVNPDNPSGVLWSMADIQRWQQKLARQKGWLILDCAFADVAQSSGENIIPAADNQLILTSVGKFFGLAGLRLGACFLPQRFSEQLRQRLGPWPVSGLSLWLLAQALTDKQWQNTQHQRIKNLQQQLLESCCHLPVYGASGLFITLKSELAEDWQRQMARQKLWTRCFKQQHLLRIGLPRQEELSRVINALKELMV